MPASGLGEGGGGVADSWALRDVTHDSLTCYVLSSDPSTRRSGQASRTCTRCCHSRTAGASPSRCGLPPESRAAAQGPRPVGLTVRPPAHAPPAPERALARAAVSLGQPRPTGRCALASRPCIPHRFACEGQQPGWARAQREAFAAAHGYGGPEEGVAVPPVVPPQSRHMREARVWPATI